MGDATAGERGAAARIDETSRMRGAHDLLVEHRHVLEQREEINLLLIVHAKHVVVRLAGEREDGRAIELRVVEAVEQMNRSGA